jgi:hypothetical protein
MPKKLPQHNHPVYAAFGAQNRLGRPGGLETLVREIGAALAVEEGTRRGRKVHEDIVH